MAKKTPNAPTPAEPKAADAALQRPSSEICALLELALPCAKKPTETSVNVSSCMSRT